MYQCLHEDHSSTPSHIVSRENPCCVSDRQSPPLSLRVKGGASSKFLEKSLSVVWLTRDVILVLLFAVSSATASFVEALSRNLCRVFWAPVTPMISCAKSMRLKTLLRTNSYRLIEKLLANTYHLLPS